MTREEAIHILDNLKPTNTKSSFDAYVVGEAITMAIKALEQEPCEVGHWIETDGKDGAFFICDKCHRQSDIKENFCPNCGSYNGGGKNEA